MHTRLANQWKRLFISSLKSVETALYQLVVRVEKALDQQEIAFFAFLDIEGSFNNTC
jgi:hypothetical protein